MKLDVFDYPDELKYTKGHIWVKEKAGSATIGVTSLGASLAKEIVHIDLPEDGEKYAAGKPIATYETIKSVSEITLPFACKINKINEKLLDNPSLINSDCYGDGWIVKVLISESDVKDLLDVNEAVKNYKKILDKEKERYKGIYD
ncbi:MAG: glycine cleavage system protein H [Candidatus Altiarchaeia archaeon]